MEVKLFRWTITSSRRAEYNLTTDVIAITFYITKTLIDKSQFKEQFTKIFMLIKTPDDCRFDFFRDVSCRLLSGILSRGVEPYCNTRCRFGLTEIYDTTCWFSDRPKFAVAEIYVSLCLLTKSAVAIDVLGNKSNNIKRISFPLEISRNPNQFNTMFS